MEERKEETKEERKERLKKYYDENKEAIKEYQRNYMKQKIDCEYCIRKLSYSSYSGHKKICKGKKN